MPLLTIPYLLRVVGIEKYGMLSFYLAGMAYVAVLADYGFNLSATRDIAIKNGNFQDISKSIISVYFIKMVILAVSAIAIWIIYNYHKSNNSNEISKIYIYTFLYVASQSLVPVWIYQGLEKIGILTGVSIVGKLISVGLIFTFVKDESEFLRVPEINAIIGMAVAFILIIYGYMKFEIKPNMPNIKEIIYQLRLGREIFLSSVFINMYANSMTFILGLSTSNISVGYFSTADKIIQAIKAMYQPVAQAIFPVISKTISKDKIKGLKFAKKYAIISAIINGILMLVILLTADKLVKLTTGMEAPESAILLKIMSPIPLLVSISNVYGVQTMLNIGMEKKFKTILMFGAIIGILLSLMLISKYKEIGAAVVVGAVETFIACAMYLGVKRELKKS